MLCFLKASVILNMKGHVVPNDNGDPTEESDKGWIGMIINSTDWVYVSMVFSSVAEHITERSYDKKCYKNYPLPEFKNIFLICRRKGEMVASACILTLSTLSTTAVLYAHSFDPDDTPSNSASQPDPSCLTLRQHFHGFWARLKHFESLSKREV